MNIHSIRNVPSLLVLCLLTDKNTKYQTRKQMSLWKQISQIDVEQSETQFIYPMECLDTKMRYNLLIIPQEMVGGCSSYRTWMILPKYMHNNGNPEEN